MHRTTTGMRRTLGAAMMVTAAAAAAAALAHADEPNTKPAPAPIEEPSVQTETTTTTPPRPALNRRSFGGKGSDRFIRAVPGRSAKAAYLGITASPAQPVLQKQLQLKAGVGLVVDGVEPGSPAALAGVREYDVLHKLDDQLLINNEQFEVLIRIGDPGRAVKLTLFREGKPLELAAKLVEREVAVTRVSIPDGGTLIAAGDLNFDVAGNDPVAASDFVALFDRANRGASSPIQPPAQVTMRAPDGTEVRASRITIESDKHKMTVTSPDGRKHLKVEDKAGAVLFDGPIGTPAELDEVPAELRQAYEQVFAAAVPDVAKPVSKSPPTPSPALEASPMPKK